jgi:HlyD family secretion protein
LLGAPAPSAGATPTPAPVPPLSPDPTPTPTPGTTGGAQLLLTDCQAAVSRVLQLQTATASAQADLDRAAIALNAAVAALQRATPAAGSSSAGTGSRPTAPPVSRGAVTAAQILSDQAQIDSAQAHLAVQRQDLDFATLTSPLAGTVVAIGLAAGAAVPAGSTGAAVTVQGAGGYTVTATVPLAQISHVAAGQKASVRLSAFAATYPGAVTSIGVLNVSQTSTPAYRVTLTLDTGGAAPRIGATAHATVTVATAAHVLTVPTSAVTVSGTRASVLLFDNGRVRRMPVTIGAVGTDSVEIRTGLSAGQRVVLADLDAQIPTASTGLRGALGGLGTAARLSRTLGR